MDDGIDAGQGVVKGFTVEYRSDNKPRARAVAQPAICQVGRVTGRKVVEHNNSAVVLLYKPSNKIGPDEAGTARDCYAHSTNISAGTMKPIGSTRIALPPLGGVGDEFSMPRILGLGLAVISGIAVIPVGSVGRHPVEDGPYERCLDLRK